MNPLNLQTDKLFYNQWPYKVSCLVDGIHLLRSYNFNIDRLNSESLTIKYYRGKLNVDFKNLEKFYYLSKSFIENKNIKKRIERNKIDFYLLTDKDLNKIENSLKDFVYSITKPANLEELIRLQTQNNIIFCKKLPHNKYKFKITFKDMPSSVRKNLIDWAEKYNNNDICINNSTRVHFKGTKPKYGTHYFYIKDKKMYSFIVLIAAGYIRKIDEYITRRMA